MITCGRKQKQKPVSPYLCIFFLNISKSGLLSLQELVPTASSREVPSTAFHSKYNLKVCLGFPTKETMRILVFMSESFLLTGEEAPPHVVCLPFQINSPNICFKSRVV